MAGISAIIPTYNAAATIRRALDSALAQTLPCAEILVIDDVSRDDTCAIVEDYAARHPSIRLIRQTRNAGPGDARNRGFDEATGDWLAILDSDDAWRPGRNAALLKAAETHGADMAFDNVVLYDAAADVEVRPGFVGDFGVAAVDEADLWRNLRFGRFLYSTFKFFVRRAFLDAHGLRYEPGFRFGEDLFLYAEILRAGGRTIKLSDEYYIYTTRHGEVSREINAGSRSMPDFMAIADRIGRFRDAHAGGFDHRTLSAMAAAERSYRAVDRLNAARVAKREGRYLRAVARLLDPKVLRLMALLRYRSAVVSRQTYG